MPASTPPVEFEHAFTRLKAILKKHARRLVVAADAPGNYLLNTQTLGPNKKPLMFGAVQLKKNYVSYHLFPVYMRPEFLATLSPELRRRMQGKACFNFKREDKMLFAELAQLTAACADWFAAEHSA